MGHLAHLRATHGLLIVNPRSGKGRPGTDELVEEGRRADSTCTC